MRHRKEVAWFAAAVALFLPVDAPGVEKLELRVGEHIVFLGNTFAVRMQYFGYFEAILQHRSPRYRVVVRNMGWSADEVGLMPRPLNFEGGAGNLYANDTKVGYDLPRSTEVDFKMLKAHLSAREADTIVLCFGANEAFKGAAGLERFTGDYQKLIDQLLAEKFNGKTTPRLVLVSPIPQENLEAPFSDPKQRNVSLKLYSERIEEIANRNQLQFADIFTATARLMSAPHEEPLTIDGLQLNARGQKEVAELLVVSLGIDGRWSDELEPLRNLVVEKNRNFFLRWRPINGEYVFGRRKEPFGVITFPPEMLQLDEMIADLDRKIHAEARKFRSPE